MKQQKSTERENLTTAQQGDSKAQSLASSLTARAASLEQCWQNRPQPSPLSTVSYLPAGEGQPYPRAPTQTKALLP